MLPTRRLIRSRPAAMRAVRVLASIFLAVPSFFASPLAWAGDAIPPVVVELFTSQGCSSCPPADAYLGDLAKRDDVLALGFHVDYWNYIGWTDPFSSKLATERQQQYARAMNLDSVYTPQMVVNGASQGVGSDREAIGRLIDAAMSAPPPRPSFTIAHPAGGSIAIHIGGVPPAGGKPATVWLVTYDREQTTAVMQGENGGRTLKDYQVVRSFHDIGVWTGVPLNIVLAPKDIAWGAGGAAVLLQINGVGAIIGAAVLAPGV
jgi:hypothetical protein